MDDNRKFIVVGTVFLIVFVGLLIIFNPKATSAQPGYWLSLAIGIGLGVLTCWYLGAVWDPKNLQLKDPNARTADPKWMAPTVILGIITARVLAYIFAPEIQVVLVNFMFGWLATTMGYMAFQVWWYRPR